MRRHKGKAVRYRIRDNDFRLLHRGIDANVYGDTWQRLTTTQQPIWFRIGVYISIQIREQVNIGEFGKAGRTWL